MLVLSRRKDQRIVIDGGRIVITVVEVRLDKVRLGIEAPADCRVDRQEIHDRRQDDRRRAGRGGD